MRLIDADRLLRNTIYNPRHVPYITESDITFAPTVDVPDRKVGEWKQGYCSECGYNWGEDAPIASVPNYCPNCGARMKGETENGRGDA